MFDYHRVANATGWPRPRKASHDLILDVMPDQEWSWVGTGLRRGAPSPTFAAGSLAVLLGFAAVTGADLTPLTSALASFAHHLALYI